MSATSATCRSTASRSLTECHMSPSYLPPTTIEIHPSASGSVMTSGSRGRGVGCLIADDLGAVDLAQRLVIAGEIGCVVEHARPRSIVRECGELRADQHKRAHV